MGYSLDAQKRFFCRPYDGEVYAVNGSGIRRFLKFDFGNHAMPDNIYEEPAKLVKAIGDPAYGYRYLFPGSMLETDSCYMVRVFDKYIRTYFIPKYGERFVYFGGVKDDMFYGGLYDFPIQVLTDGKVISVAQPEPFVKYLDQIRKSDQDFQEYVKEKAGFYKMIADVKMDDNPVLIISRMRIPK